MDKELQGTVADWRVDVNHDIELDVEFADLIYLTENDLVKMLDEIQKTKEQG